MKDQFDYCGQCPQCESYELTYGGFVNAEASYYPFVCRDCGCRGKEYYSVDFLRMESDDVEAHNEKLRGTEERTEDACETFNEAPYGNETDDSDKTFNEAPYGED